jgi:hypothetical protein
MLAGAVLRERRRRVSPQRAAQTAGHSLRVRNSSTAARPSWARAFAPWMLLPIFQGAPPTEPAEPAPQAAVELPTAFVGSWRSGMLELRTVLADGDLDKAKQLGDSLAAMNSLDDRERAQLQFQRGLLAERRAEYSDASAAFASAGGLAPSGTLRLNAWYNAGTVDLEAAELLFLQIPEAREARKLPPLEPAAPAAPGASKPKPEDKHQDLERAAAAFRVAKQGLVLRVRADWHAADPRANLELIQRRLRELEQIREQRKQQEEQQEKDPQDKPEDSKDKPEDSKDKPEDQEKQDPKDGDPKDSEQEPKPQEEPQDPKDSEQEKPPSEEQKPEPDKPEDAKPPEPGPAQAEPRELSKEEISRLLDQLQNIEKEARELQARMRARRRAAVEKDW